ncbi:MAG: hypothetical protein HXS52_01445 [Theionarchaea archaeon]|nr:hypothetical protein [Theionarchaea archaeon]MBU7036567.1 hypothetical protein [Theionarchaea archaeon]
MENHVVDDLITDTSSAFNVSVPYSIMVLKVDDLQSSYPLDPSGAV